MTDEVASKAGIGWQDEIWIGRTGSDDQVTWTEVLGIENLDFPEKTPDGIDVTHMKSPGRSKESIPGLQSEADYSTDLQYWPGQPHDVILEALAAATETGEPEYVQVEFKIKGGARRTYRGYVAAYTPKSPVGEKRMVSLAMKLAGRIAVNPRVEA